MDYRKPSGRWGGSGVSPTDKLNMPGASNPWRERDLAMLVALIDALQKQAVQQRTFRDPRRRRQVMHLRINTQEAMAGLQRTNGTLSENARATVEKMLKVNRIVPPPRPIGIEPSVDIYDGMPKPLKPPVRITMQDDEDDE